MKKKTNIVLGIALGAISAMLIIAAICLGYFLAQKNQNSSQTEKATVKETAVQTERQTESQTETIQQTEAQTETEFQTETETQTESQIETESETEAAAEQVIGENSQGPLVVIDAGHQGPGQDMSGYEEIGPGSGQTKPRIVSGTQGRYTGVPEYELNLNVALLLKQELEARGYRVIMTRETQDINISNIERAQIANENNADIMVRIHANGDDNGSVCGALTMAPSAGNPYVGSMYQECNYLASCIINAYCEATGLVNDGILEVDNMTGINWCQMPVTIVEMGFMTNEGDDYYMADTGNQWTMAYGIANGIDAYFGKN